MYVCMYVCIIIIIIIIINEYDYGGIKLTLQDHLTKVSESHAVRSQNYW